MFGVCAGGGGGESVSQGGSDVGGSGDEQVMKNWDLGRGGK